MSERKNNSPERTDDREIVITRVFDAPRELVFDAWTNPTHLTQWWGPRGFTTTTHEMQVKVGGVWRFIMHGPDGTDYPNKITYREVVRPERLVYAHVGESDDEPGSFVTTTTFEEQSGKTKVTMRAVFRTAAERDDVIKKHRALEGGNQTLDRLGEHLANMGAATKPFVISRAFNASRELVFKVWTDRDHLMRWWGPKEVTMVSCRNDLRPGARCTIVCECPMARTCGENGSIATSCRRNVS
jgi:uncharacterized protein YndB with AHSA1/START domain